MNFLLRTPFFRLLLALIAGLFTYRYAKLSDLMALLIAVPAFLLIVSTFFTSDLHRAYRLRWGFGAGLMVLVYLTGYLLAQRQEQLLAFNFTEKPVLYQLKVMESPQIKQRSVLCVVSPSLVADSVTPNEQQQQTGNAKAIVYLQRSNSALALQRGDYLLARVDFNPPSDVQNPEGFNYAAWLRGKGIAATAYVDSLRWTKLNFNSKQSFLSVAEQARNSLLGLYRRLELPQADFAVLAALTLGYKDELEPEIRSHYSASGAMHILSVSGLHVGVIYLIVNSVLSLLFRKPSLLSIKTVMMVLALWGYAFVTGLSPSVVRASSMFSMVAIGKALERRAQIYNTISSTAFVLLLFNPSYLYDVGFQLSYTAVLGIVYFQPKIALLLAVKNKALKWLWDLTSVSLAAQLGTLPLALFYFNQFPNYFLLTNYVAIPLSTFIIYAAVSYLAIAWVPMLSDLVGWVLRKLIFLQNQAVEIIHDLPGSVSQVYAGPADLMLMLVVLACWIGYAELKKYIFIPIALATLLMAVSWRLYTDMQLINSSQMIVYSDRKESHLHFTAGRREWIFTSDSSSFDKISGKFRLRHRFKTEKTSIADGSFYTVFNQKKIAVVADDRFVKKLAPGPLEVDYLIVQTLSGRKAAELMPCFNARVCIAGASLSDYYTRNLREWCDEKGVLFYSLAESGAYREGWGAAR